jgi:hypothetical protein
MHMKSEKSLPEPRLPFTGTVPPTPAEEQAAAASWRRHGLLRRLVRT